MVSDVITATGAAAFFLLFVGSVTWLTWLSVRDDRHSPPSEREGGDDAA